LHFYVITETIRSMKIFKRFPLFFFLAFLLLLPLGQLRTQVGKDSPTGLSGVFNVRDFGAVGDGMHNDQPAFVSAIAAAQSAGGGIVYVPNGTYLIESPYITLANNIHLKGAGKGAAIIKQGVLGAPGNLITASGISYWSVGDLTLDLGDPTLVSGSPQLAAISAGPNGCTYWRVNNCALIRLGRYGVFVTDGNHWQVEDNYFSRVTRSIYQNLAIIAQRAFADVYNAEIRGNICDNIAAIQLNGRDSIISKNIVTGHGYGAGIVTGEIFQCRRNVIEGNICASGTGTDENGKVVGGFELWGFNHSIVNNVAYNNAGGGMAVGANGSVVIGNLAYDNGRSGQTGNQDGFTARYVDAIYNANGTTWVGNRAFDSSGTSGNQLYGLSEQSASLASIKYISNNFSGNAVDDTLYKSSTSTKNSTLLTGTATLDFPSTANGSASTIGGVFLYQAGVNDQVLVGTPPAFPNNILLTGSVTAANSLRITMVNHSGSPYNPPSNVFNISVVHWDAVLH
jgi:hypothetical protein